MAEKRAGARSDEGVESVEIHTADGHALRATVREGDRGVKAQGVAVLSHAMFARRSEWSKGFAAFLSARGWRTIAFDFRGHGESGTGAAKGGRWTYEDLVARDFPAAVDGARARARGRKVVVVGHSLGGHVAAAAQATGAIDVDALAMIGSNMWLEEIEPSFRRKMAKRAVAGMMDAVTKQTGYFPARRLRLGSDDEAAPYIGALVRSVRPGFWGSEDGRLDYWDGLRQVRIPIFALASDGDTLNAHPECAARFALRTKGRVTIERIRAADDGGEPPGHMEMVTSERSVSAWGKLERWMRGE